MDAHSASMFVLTLIHLLLYIRAHDFLSPGSSLSLERSSDVLYSPDGTFTCGSTTSLPMPPSSQFGSPTQLKRLLCGVQILIVLCTPQILLEWKKRFKIALGVAKDLAYIHHECLEWVIHCDVKPKNILLDENLEPKITDFGLAKLLNRGGSNKNVSRIHGTRGYIAPEWVSSLPITAKVDVYIFGVVLLELLKGSHVSEWEKTEDEDDEVEKVLRRAVRMLAENMKLQEGSEQPWIADFIDSRLNGQFNYLQARTMVKVVVSCIDEDRNKRPTMENVAQKLLSVDEGNTIP